MRVESEPTLELARLFVRSQVGHIEVEVGLTGLSHRTQVLLVQQALAGSLLIRIDHVLEHGAALGVVLEAILELEVGEEVAERGHSVIHTDVRAPEHPTRSIGVRSRVIVASIATWAGRIGARRSAGVEVGAV